MNNSRKYVGHKQLGIFPSRGTITVVSISDRAVAYPLPHYVRHSPDGFNWGYGGSGAMETARCILYDHLGHDPATELYRRFCQDVIAVLPTEGFTLLPEQIELWRKNINTPIAVGILIKNATESATRIDGALELARSHGQTDGDHHKLWVIDQMVRALLGDEASYTQWVADYCNGEDGADTYAWDTGIAP